VSVSWGSAVRGQRREDRELELVGKSWEEVGEQVCQVLSMTWGSAVRGQRREDGELELVGKSREEVEEQELREAEEEERNAVEEFRKRLDFNMGRVRRLHHQNLDPISWSLSRDRMSCPARQIGPAAPTWFR
jgi:hypothetical protein